MTGGTAYSCTVDEAKKSFQESSNNYATWLDDLKPEETLTVEFTFWKREDDSIVYSESWEQK